MATSAVLFATMAACVRLASRELPNAPIVFFRHFLMLVFLLPWAARQGWRALRTDDFPGHVVRALAGLSAIACYFYAIARLRLADAVLLNQSMPLFIPLVERAWLRERIPPRLWGVLLLGFVGLLFILRPGIGVFEPAALVGLASAAAGVGRAGRRPTPDAHGAGDAHRLLLRPRSPRRSPCRRPSSGWRTPSAFTWGALLLMGIFATAGQLTLTRSYVYAPAARVGPFLYAGPVAAALLDWLIWGVLPDALFVVGAAIVIVAAILALRLRTAARSVTPGS